GRRRDHDLAAARGSDRRCLVGMAQRKIGPGADNSRVSRGVYTATCVPTSTTRPVGIWKKSVASLADLASAMNSRSCQRGIPDWAAGLSARRERKNEVDMMSN